MWMISIAHESTYRGAVSRKFLEIDQEKRISILPMEKHTITGKHWGSVEICSVVFHLAKKTLLKNKTPFLPDSLLLV